MRAGPQCLRKHPSDGGPDTAWTLLFSVQAGLFKDRAMPHLGTFFPSNKSDPDFSKMFSVVHVTAREPPARHVIGVWLMMGLQGVLALWFGVHGPGFRVCWTQG